MLAGLFLVAAILAGLIGAVGLSDATFGVGFIAGGCLLGIIGRMIQANDHHDASMRALGRTRDGSVPTPKP